MIVVLTPVDEELAVLSDAFEKRWPGATERNVGRIPSRIYGDGQVLLAQGGLGKVQFALRTQHLVDQLEEVGLVVCAGTGGALANALSVGDVVVGTTTVEHDFNWNSQKPLPEFPGSEAHLAVLKGRTSWMEGTFGAHFGPIASGDEAILDSKRAQEVYERTGALAVAWEGAGGAKAAQFADVPYLELRGISDNADHEASAVWEGNIPTAIENVAAVIDSLV